MREMVIFQRVDLSVNTNTQSHHRKRERKEKNVALVTGHWC